MTQTESQATEGPLLLRVPDLARLLGCSESAARNLIARQAIPSRRLGRRVVILRRELEACLETLERPGEPFLNILDEGGR